MQPARKTHYSALEMTMRNVMDNLEEDANWQMLTSKAWEMEILSIEPDRPLHTRQKAPVSKLFAD